MPPKKSNNSEPCGSKKNQRKWTTRETEDVLSYLKDTIRAGKSIEKPTAEVYYGELLTKVKGMNACTVSQLKNKIRHLKKSYSDTIQWREQTGQGVRETEGEDSFRAVTVKRCPNFDDLDEIYGTKLNIFPPTVLQSSNDDMDSDSELTGPNDLLPTLSPQSLPPTEATVTKKDDIEKKQLKKTKDCGSIAALLESRKERNLLESKKIDIELKKLDFEKQKWKDEMEIKRRRLDLEEAQIKLESQRIVLKKEN